MEARLRATLPDQERVKRYEQMVRCREFEEAYESVKAGWTLLACSCGSEDKSNKNRLEGFSLQGFRADLTEGSKSEELISTSARPAENSSAGLANDQERR